jgi:hypothetical protein
MSADARLTAAYEALSAAHDADCDDETDSTPVPPEVYAELRAAEEAWVVGKTIAVAANDGGMTVITFTDGTRMSFEGNVRSDLCDDCLDRLECEPLMYVREDVDIRVELHKQDVTA